MINLFFLRIEDFLKLADTSLRYSCGCCESPNDSWILIGENFP